MKRFLPILLLLLAWVGAANAATIPCASGFSLSKGGTLLGTMVGDPATDTGRATNQSFTAAMGRPAALMDTYVADDVTTDQWADSANYSAAGISAPTIPVVGIPMAIIGHDGDADFKAIIRGDWDTAILNTFQIYVNHGHLGFYIRPGWEMNGDWYPWAITAENAADFKAAFQHIATLAHGFKNAMISVIWNPGYVPNARASTMSYFPGAEYVDSIGIDTYGAASGMPDTAPFAAPGNPNTFTLQDAIALAKATGKPLSLPETGGGPGDTAFPQNLAEVIVKSGVRVDAVIIWDDYYGLATSGHWSDDPAASAAWKKAFADIAASSAAASATATTTSCVQAVNAYNQPIPTAAPAASAAPAAQPAAPVASTPDIPTATPLRRHHHEHGRAHSPPPSTVATATAPSTEQVSLQAAHDASIAITRAVDAAIAAQPAQELPYLQAAGEATASVSQAVNDAIAAGQARMKGN